MLVISLLLLFLIKFCTLASVNTNIIGSNFKDQSHNSLRGGVAFKHYGQGNRTFVSYQTTDENIISEHVPQLIGMLAEYLKFTGSMCKLACDVNVDSPYLLYNGTEHFLSDFITKTVKAMPLVSVQQF